MRSSRTTHGSLMVSLILHALIALCLFFFLFGIDEKIEDLIDVHLFEVRKTPPPKPRPPIIKPVISPQPQQWTGDVVYDSSPKPQVRSISTSSIQRAPAPFTTVTRFANQPLVQGVSVAPSPDVSKLQIATVVDLPVAQLGLLPISSGPQGASEGMGLLSTSAQLGGEGGGTGVGRGGGTGQGGGTGRASDRFAHAALTMVLDESSITLTDMLPEIADDVRLGDLPVEPLPRGVPGGRVIGRGRDIRGVARYVRLQHRLADWWIDASSLIGLAHFINANTNIHVDMNVEGGSLKLSDPEIMKSPLVIMTGHDPALGKQIPQLGQMTGMTTQHFTDMERQGLRRYLLGSGLLFYDDCGLDSKDYPLMRIVASELRLAIPEYPITNIPNNHELYSCYYALGGPPWGCAFIWRHGPQTPIRDYLEGILIDGRLAVVLCGRDYLCAMQTVELHAGKVHNFVPAYRLMTNALVYSLTHGSISEHEHYVPEPIMAGDIPRKPPVLPKME